MTEKTTIRKCKYCNWRHEPIPHRTEILGEWRGIPIIKAYMTSKGEYWVFWCDHCQCEHTHGVSTKEKYHRMAHCGVEGSPFRPRGYFLSKVDPLLLKIEEEEREKNEGTYDQQQQSSIEGKFVKLG